LQALEVFSNHRHNLCKGTKSKESPCKTSQGGRMPMANETAQAVRQALDWGASDLHLSAGLPPMARVHGVLRPLSPDAPAWNDAQVRQVVQQLMSPARWSAFQDQREDDFAFTHPDWGRWRVNAFQQQRGAALVLRFIPAAVPRLVELNAPALLSDLALQAHGLILVTGPTGCGKSTLLAALLDHANRTLQGHLLTIEDPIEFVHTPQQCAINQREVGLHTHSFEAALRSALRADPDVILIGELRDLSTIRLALTACWLLCTRPAHHKPSTGWWTCFQPKKKTWFEPCWPTPCWRWWRKPCAHAKMAQAAWPRTR
jgi:pilus retraction protein PilT